MTTFEAAYRADDNHWWYSQSGDCQNAYDAALDELDELRAAVARVRALASYGPFPKECLCCSCAEAVLRALSTPPAPCGALDLEDPCGPTPH